MKRIVKILLVLIALLVLLIIVIFGLRLFNQSAYNWDEHEFVYGYHDYNTYPSEFAGGIVTHFEHGEANGFHFEPNDPIDAQPIVMFGGSEGSSNFEEAQTLAEKGYETYALFFFGAPNQQDTLNRVPLEFFSDFIDAFTLEDEPVTVIGYSKGAELALNLTNYYSTIENLILYTPGEYSYMGLEFSEDSGSSWTWQGEELPYISFDDTSGWSLTKMMIDMLIARPVEYRETYETAVKNSDNRDAARIDSSNISGQVLLFAGREDVMWQADIAAEQIGKALGDQAEVVIYPEAGHAFGMPPYFAGMALGGTEEANMEAKEDSDQKLLQFLEQNSAD